MLSARAYDPTFELYVSEVKNTKDLKKDIGVEFYDCYGFLQVLVERYSEELTALRAYAQNHAEEGIQPKIDEASKRLQYVKEIMPGFEDRRAHS